jgi:Zn-dependent protease with chaperone function
MNQFQRLTAIDIVNAQVSASGKVIVYSGILPVCLDETGIATVLSHEIAHVVAGHETELASAHTVLAVASIPALPFLVLPHCVIMVELAVIFVPYLSQLVGSFMFLSRKQESEAGYIGLIMMSKAGYDIRQAPEFWERMKETTDTRLEEKDENGKPKYIRSSELASSHPHVKYDSSSSKPRLV